MYKKVDSSMFKGWITLTTNFVEENPIKNNLLLGKGKEITVIFEDKKYQCSLRWVNRKINAVYQLRFDSNKDLVKKIREEFIQSYVIIKSQRETQQDEKQFRSNLKAGNQEVLIIETINEKTLIFKTYIQVKSEWNTLFKRLAREGAFDWVFDKNKDKEYLIQYSSNWMSATQLKKHKDKQNVIYYLVDSIKKELYIGKANNLGQRVKIGRSEIKGWDKFRYDLIRPEFSNILERIEDHTIRAFASVLENTQKFDTLGLSEYKLVNKNWKKLN
jgi:hypothetical protein